MLIFINGGILIRFIWIFWFFSKLKVFCFNWYFVFVFCKLVFLVLMFLLFWRNDVLWIWYFECWIINGDSNSKWFFCYIIDIILWSKIVRILLIKNKEIVCIVLRKCDLFYSCVYLICGMFDGFGVLYFWNYGWFDWYWLLKIYK